MSLDSYSISRELTAEQTYLQSNTLGSSNHSLLDNCVSCFGSTEVTPAYVALYVSAILVVIITVFGNLLVITSVCHFKQLHTPTNVLILFLAVTDFFVGIFVMPLQFIWLIESCWFFGTTVCAFFNFVSFHLTCASVHIVALIAVDRCMALSSPFFYSNKITANLFVIVASLNWVFSMAYNFALLYSNGFFTHALTLCPYDCLIIVNEIWSWVDFVVVFVLPCSIMIILYLIIFAIAKRHANAIRAANNQGNPNAGKNDHVPKRSERKAAKVLGILVSVFLLCVVPYYIASVIPGSINTQLFNDVLNYTSALLYLNSLFNPIIYALFYPWFKKSMKLILRCRVCSPDSSLMNVK
ncbi:trace amine-associated receptor 13c-like [Clupea harengus]|uniref:Trace amine-associated receptor 13c-like n=1 Tax=Clupea harengus TaxID=7950 RepID=A0A6P8GQF9_CLUHA|nr:trace amine-associated receptor 13c-like [Clupea harengus]